VGTVWGEGVHRRFESCASAERGRRSAAAMFSRRTGLRTAAEAAIGSVFHRPSLQPQTWTAHPAASAAPAIRCGSDGRGIGTDQLICVHFDVGFRRLCGRRRVAAADADGQIEPRDTRRRPPRRIGLCRWRRTGSEPCRPPLSPSATQPWPERGRPQRSTAAAHQNLHTRNINKWSKTAHHMQKTALTASPTTANTDGTTVDTTLRAKNEHQRRNFIERNCVPSSAGGGLGVLRRRCSDDGGAA